ncbi:Transposon Ty3-G Gag-Pol polyprotein [Dictyocoela muelleri]|nr:Transposon Ty3-G Gag-Pol polyprotein [Dictyocoela muelleri]
MANKNKSENEIERNLFRKMTINNIDYHVEMIEKELLDIVNDQPKLGYFKGIENEIPLKENILINKKGFMAPNKLVKGTKNEINRLKEEGIIRNSFSKFSSPAFPLLKKNGDIRIVVDYRDLNKYTEHDPFPNPSVDEMLIGLNKAKYFTTLDLNHGYHQISIKKEDIFKTAFIIMGGHYEYTRMPFGLSNAPKTFQRAMKNMLDEFEYVKIFLDDILIFSENLADHKLHVESVLKKLKYNGLTINKSKSKFLNEKIVYLGRLITQQGITIEPNKNIAFNTSTIPTTKKKLQKLLGTINWFRPFIAGLSSMMIPITEKLKYEKISWNEKDTEIIKKIFNEIQKAPTIAHIDPNKDVTLYCDSSEYAIGSILVQHKSIVGIYSYKFNKTEINYSISEKELYSIVKSLLHFRVTILGHKIFVYTDSKNAISLGSSLSKRANRWLMSVCEFNLN